MKKLVSTLLVMGLLLTTMVWNVYAEEATPDQAEKNKVSVVSYGVFPGGSFLGSTVHEQAYLTYLVKEYSPDTLPGWEEAFTQRNEAVKKAKEQVQTSVSSQEAVLEAKELAVPPITMTFKGDSNEDGTVTEDSLIKIHKASNITIVNKGIGLPEELKAKSELYQKFEKAVADKNAEDIKAILPELLADYNQSTEQIQNLKVFVKKAADLKQE